MFKYSALQPLVEKCVLLILLVVAVHVAGREVCDKTKCSGPVRYYEDLGCTPIYTNPNDCCASEYNCTHLKNLSKDKCYANNHEYSIGETLKDEDANPCDIGCKCLSLDNEVASFICAQIDCAFLPPQPNCFYRHTPNQCCPGPWVCLKEGEERASCEVDGNTYVDGEYFTPKSDPDLECHCMPGYKGENVEPFCTKPKRAYCTPLFRNARQIHDNCAPVFYTGQKPQKDCSYNSRCQNPNDTVIHNHEDGKSVSVEENKTCLFGDLVMHIGDELNQGTNYDSVCVKCLCEVPPIPTCHRIPDEECDLSQQREFPASADLSCQHTKQSVGAIYTRTNFVTLKYVTDSWGTISNGFRLVITAVKDPKHTCKDFRCTQNEFCIETDLLCDGVNHCGDGSDEATSTLCANSEASTILGMQTIWFAVALVFLILSVAGLVTAGVLCFCRQRAATPRHPHNAHNAQTHPPVSFPLQQMYGSNGTSAGLPVGMTTLKGTTGSQGALGTYGWALGSGVTGATTLPRPGNWLRPAGLRHGHSAARVRLYCQAK